MRKYIDLDRRFSKYPDSFSEESSVLVQSLSRGRIGWAELLERSCSVIVAGANHGKTAELLNQARRLQDKGGHALFIRLNKIYKRDDFLDNLDIEDEEAFKRWANCSSLEILTVFVDSLDEVILKSLEDMYQALKVISQKVGNNERSVRWIFSARPAVINSEVISRMQSLLTLNSSRRPLGRQDIGAGAENISTEVQSFDLTDDDTGRETQETAEGIEVYRMEPLSRIQAERLLTLKLGSSSGAKQIYDAALNLGLDELSVSPGGLDVLRSIDLINNPPACLTDVYENIIASQSEVQSSEIERNASFGLNSSQFQSAVFQLSSASLLCSLPNIEIPTETLSPSDGVMSARKIVFSSLNESALRYFLTTNFFIDSGPHQVKVYPDRLLYFFAAKRLSFLVTCPEDAARLVRFLSWNSPSGESGVYSRFLPLAGWLATLSPLCRAEIIKVDPQACALFGDLRSNEISSNEALKCFELCLERLERSGDTIGRGLFYLTSENYWQATSVAIISNLPVFFKKYSKNNQIRNLLIQIAKVSKVDVLRGVILDEISGDYTSLLESSLALDYILDLRDEGDIKELLSAFDSSGKTNIDIASNLIGELGFDYFSVSKIAGIYVDFLVRDADLFQFNWTISKYLLVEKNSAEIAQLTLELIRQYAAINKATFDFSFDSRQFLEFFDDLAAFIVDCSQMSVDERSDVLYRLNNFIFDNFPYVYSFKRTKLVLEEKIDVRQEVLKKIIIELSASVPEDSLLNSIYNKNQIVDLLESDAAAIGAQSLVSEIDRRRVQSIKISNERPVKPTKDVLELSVIAELKKLLESESPEDVERALIWVVKWVGSKSNTMQFGQRDFSIFERNAPNDIVVKVCDGLKLLWRNSPPLHDEQKPSVIYYKTVAGLIGLSLELGTVQSSSSRLQDADIVKALDYAHFELNGYPVWFWPLVQQRPEICLPELKSVFSQAHKTTFGKYRCKKLVENLRGAPEELKGFFAGEVINFIVLSTGLSDNVISSALELVLATDSQIDVSLLEAFSESLIKEAYTAGGYVTPEKTSAFRQTTVLFACAWISRDLDRFLDTFEALILSRQLNHVFLLDVVRCLRNERLVSLSALGRGSNFSSAAFERLYYLIVKVSEWPISSQDASFLIEPEFFAQDSGEGFSLRHELQSFGNEVLSLISKNSSEAAYAALGRIKTVVNDTQLIAYIQRLQFSQREFANYFNPLVQHKYLEFEKNFSLDTSDFHSFAKRVFVDILEVKRDIEIGDLSMRRFFNRLVYKNPKKDTEKLALEEDFQVFMAHHMRFNSRKDYAITIESMLSNSTRRDILCQVNGCRATVELKMATWTITELLYSLEHQLYRGYMNEMNSKIGFFVVVLGKKRKWRMPGTGKSASFCDVLKLLQSRAKEICESDSSLYLRVVGIDATEDPDLLC